MPGEPVGNGTGEKLRDGVSSMPLKEWFGKKGTSCSFAKEKTQKPPGKVVKAEVWPLVNSFSGNRAARKGAHENRLPEWG